MTAMRFLTTPRHNVQHSSSTSLQLSTVHTYEIRDTANKNGGKYAELRHASRRGSERRCQLA